MKLYVGLGIDLEGLMGTNNQNTLCACMKSQRTHEKIKK